MFLNIVFHSYGILFIAVTITNIVDMNSNKQFVITHAKCTYSNRSTPTYRPPPRVADTFPPGAVSSYRTEGRNVSVARSSTPLLSVFRPNVFSASVARVWRYINLIITIITITKTEKILRPPEWQAPFLVRISQPYVVLENHSYGIHDLQVH